MEQQVNLFHPIFRTPKTVFSLRAILLVLGVLMGGLGLVTLATQWQQGVLQSERQQLEARRTQATQRLQSLSDNLGPRQSDPQLAEQLAEQQALRQQKLESLQVLSQGNVDESSGFSSYLDGLSQRRIKGLWLNDILIDNGGLSLTLAGRTHHQALVPSYLELLAQEQVYAGKQFAELRLDRVADSDDFNFVLSTERGARP